MHGVPSRLQFLSQQLSVDAYGRMQQEKEEVLQSPQKGGSLQEVPRP
jgi:hypothetical protein